VERRSEAEMRNIENRHRRVLGPNFDAEPPPEIFPALKNLPAERAYAAARP
jgi:hypothetical protein